MQSGRNSGFKLPNVGIVPIDESPFSSSKPIGNRIRQQMRGAPTYVPNGQDVNLLSNLGTGFSESVSNSSLPPPFFERSILSITNSLVQNRDERDKKRKFVLNKLNRLRSYFPDYNIPNYSSASQLSVEELETIYRAHSNKIRGNLMYQFQLLQEHYRDELEIQIPAEDEYLETLNSKFNEEIRKVLKKDVIKKREQMLLGTFGLLQIALNKFGFNMDGYIQHQMKNISNYRLILGQGIKVSVPGTEFTQGESNSPFMQLGFSVVLSTVLFAVIGYICKDSTFKNGANQVSSEVEKELRNMMMGDDDTISKIRRTKDGEKVEESNNGGIINTVLQTVSNMSKGDFNPTNLMGMAAQFMGGNNNNQGQKTTEETNEAPKPKEKAKPARRKVNFGDE